MMYVMLRFDARYFLNISHTGTTQISSPCRPMTMTCATFNTKYSKIQHVFLGFRSLHIWDRHHNYIMLRSYKCFGHCVINWKHATQVAIVQHCFDEFLEIDSEILI